MSSPNTHTKASAGKRRRSPSPRTSLNPPAAGAAPAGTSTRGPTASSLVSAAPLRGGPDESSSSLPELATLVNNPKRPRKGSGSVPQSPRGGALRGAVGSPRRGAASSPRGAAASSSPHRGDSGHGARGSAHARGTASSDRPRLLSPRSTATDFRKKVNTVLTIQTQLRAFDDQCCADQILIQRGYDQLKTPLFQKRSQLISHIPEFWPRVFMRMLGGGGRGSGGSDGGGGSFPVPGGLAAASSSANGGKASRNAVAANGGKAAASSKNDGSDFELAKVPPLLSRLTDVRMRDNLDAFGSHEFSLTFGSGLPGVDGGPLTVAKLVNCALNTVSVECVRGDATGGDGDARTDGEAHRSSGQAARPVSAAGRSGGEAGPAPAGGDLPRGGGAGPLGAAGPSPAAPADATSAADDAQSRAAGGPLLPPPMLLKLLKKTLKPTHPSDVKFFAWVFSETYDNRDLGAAFRRSVWQNPYALIEDWLRGGDH